MSKRRKPPQLGKQLPDWLATAESELKSELIAATSTPKTQQEAEAKLFAGYVGKITPLAGRKRFVVDPPAATPPHAPLPASPPLQAAAPTTAPLVILAESPEYWVGACPGLSNNTLAQLRRGRLPYEQYLDLHGMIQTVAHHALVEFIVRARQQGVRCVLVITGRGRSSPQGVAVLRNRLPEWLCQAPLLPHVLAFATAKARDGGPGAFYVLLRRLGVKPVGAPPPD